MLNPACFLAAHGRMENGDPMPPCEGRLRRCHLITQQELRKCGLLALADDQATWVLGCGGITGVSGHHGMMDYSLKLRLPFAALPPATVRFAVEHDLMPWLEREYR